MKSTFPSKNDVVAEQRDAFELAVVELSATIEEGHQYARQAIELLQRKAGAPNVAISPDDLPDELRVSNWANNLCTQTDVLNKVIEVHNKAHDEFQQHRESAKNKLKRHYLAEGHDDYRRLEKSVEKAERAMSKVKGFRDGLSAEIDELKQSMRHHGPAAERVNAMVHRYLGHKELQIAAKEEGYEIRRCGEATTAPPSEGEKTAIALCYFLVKLDADGRQRKDLIIVLDDPISSLDTRSLNYSCSLIRSLEKVGQLIVLTHNLHVMNEVKKWLKNGTEREKKNKGKENNEATAALFFIDTIQSVDASSRSSSIVE